MSLDESEPAFEALRKHLAPYARDLLDRARLHARRLHAEQVTIEHLLSAVLQDDESGAHALVLHAFADPDTISSEALAISPGVMVVASHSTLPFSAGGLTALLAARELSAGAEVLPGELFGAALAVLPDAALDALRGAGFDAEPTRLPDPLPPETVGGPLFEHFSSDAKRVLSFANRGAAESNQDAIGPAQIVVGGLRVDEALAGMPWQRTRMVLSPFACDDTPLVPRNLPADPGLSEYLGRLPEGAGSVALLGEMLDSGPAELILILDRHKVTRALVERAENAFPDPDIRDS